MEQVAALLQFRFTESLMNVIELWKMQKKTKTTINVAVCVHISMMSGMTAQVNARRHTEV